MLLTRLGRLNAGSLLTGQQIRASTGTEVPQELLEGRYKAYYEGYHYYNAYHTGSLKVIMRAM